MDRRQANPFQVRDANQPNWSFERLNESIRVLGHEMPGPSTHEIIQRLPLSSTVPQHPSSQRPLRPGPETHNWYNPLARNPNELSRSHRAQANAASDSFHPATAPVPSRQPVYPLGTMEEVQADDYVSPLTTMYGRAWNRYREAEENRAANRQASADARQVFTRRSTANTTQNQANPLDDTLGVLGSSPPQHQVPGQLLAESMETRRRVSLQSARDRLDRLQQAQERIREATEAILDPLEAPRVNPIDTQPLRPPPLTSDDMIVNVECRICHEQKMDTILEPCNHLAVCRWCVELMRERHRRYRYDPENGDAQLKCPICRRRVTGQRRVYLV